MVTHLTGHDFTVDSTDIDSGIKTSLIVSVYNISTEGLVCSRATIVRTLHGTDSDNYLTFRILFSKPFLYTFQLNR